ncbi:methyl-accepting chemotaxis protein [Puniceicoccaceae bacterium K14]|nr:methyl-accepting chemotaxis protein [Puniceicoccaceae bacterium K14]
MNPQKNKKTEFEYVAYAKSCRFLLIILAVQIPVFAIAGAYFDTGVVLALVLGGLIVGGPALLHFMSPRSEAVGAAIAIAMLSMSGLLIHLGRGMIEMHFHVFVSLALLIGLARMSAVLVGAATIAVHHVGFYFFLPDSVFNYDASIGIVVLHAAFVVVEAIPSCVVANQFGKYIRAQAVISEKLSRMSAELKKQTGHISSSCTALASQASTQAASIEETSASLVELSSVTQETTSHANDAKSSANRARAIAEKGASEVALMNKAMQDIRSSSNNIANIIKSIDEIAFQTNILALNAAVEAARAGEAGAGFAVVADEVRSLAQRSALAAQETAEKIEDSVARSERGVEISGRVSGQLEEIFSMTQDVDELIAKIAEASKEQNLGISQISEATNEIDRVTQESVSQSEANARFSQSLNQLSEELSQSVEQIDEILGSERQTVSNSQEEFGARYSAAPNELDEAAVVERAKATEEAFDWN